MVRAAVVNSFFGCDIRGDVCWMNCRNPVLMKTRGESMKETEGCLRKGGHRCGGVMSTLVTIRAISFDGISDDIYTPVLPRLAKAEWRRIRASLDSYQQLGLNYIFVSLPTHTHFSNFRSPISSTTLSDSARLDTHTGSVHFTQCYSNSTILWSPSIFVTSISLFTTCSASLPDSCKSRSSTGS